MLVKTLGFKGMAKYLGKEWQKLDKEARERYKVLAARDKVRYTKELVDFHNEQDEFLARFNAMEQAQDLVASLAEVPKKTPPTHSSPQATPQVAQPPATRQATKVTTTQVFDKRELPLNPKAGFVTVDLGFHEVCELDTIAHPRAIPVTQCQLGSANLSCCDLTLPRNDGFDHETSLKKMAREFGNDGIDYLLSVLAPTDDHSF